MAYATYIDVQNRTKKQLSTDDQNICTTLLEDVAVLIDAYNENADIEKKKIVSCRVVIRAMVNNNDDGIPIGATQGTMSALGYSQTFTISGGGSIGQIYLDKTDKKYLGCNAKIGMHSPLEDMVIAND